MPILATLAAIDAYTVNIDGEVYNRADLVVVTDEQSGTLTISSSFTLVDAVQYTAIAVNGDEGSSFASFNAMSRWVAANVVYNVVVVTIGTVNTVGIGVDTYKRNALDVRLSGDEETITVIDKLNDDQIVLNEKPYYELEPDNTGSTFASFSDMSQWVANNMQFQGYSINAVADKGCFLINGKPYPKGRMFFKWYDEAESVEVRYSHYDYAEKPIPETPYTGIVLNDANDAPESYKQLIDFVTNNCF